MTVPGRCPPLSDLYRETRRRLAALAGDLDREEWDRPVPACPGWTVHDVYAHLVAVAEDVVAGRLTRPPTDEETAAQVARFRGHGGEELLARWEHEAPPLEEAIDSFTVWPAVLDAASHEQDIRGAVGRPGARDSAVVHFGSERLVTLLRPAKGIRVVVEDAEFSVGPQGGRDGGELVVQTDRFEAFRWRLGRRSRAQLAGLHWSGDPTPVLDELVIFGPSPYDIVE